MIRLKPNFYYFTVSNKVRKKGVRDFHSVGVTLKAPPNLRATLKALLSIDQAQQELHHNKYFNARFQSKHALMTNKL